MTKRIIAAGLAALVAGSLAACSAPAQSSSPSAAAATQAAAVTTQPPASTAPASAVGAPGPTRSPGPGSVKSEPGEDVFDFNIRKAFWAEVQKDGVTASLYQSDTYNKFRESAGFHAPNGNMTTQCTLGARIASTPERLAAMRSELHQPALDVPGVKVFGYPVTCPGASDHPRNYVLVAAVNPNLKVEELSYVPDGPDTVLFGVPDSSRL